MRCLGRGRGGEGQPGASFRLRSLIQSVYLFPACLILHLLLLPRPAGLDDFKKQGVVVWEH